MDKEKAIKMIRELILDKIKSIPPIYVDADGDEWCDIERVDVWLSLNKYISNNLK